VSQLEGANTRDQLLFRSGDGSETPILEADGSTSRMDVTDADDSGIVGVEAGAVDGWPTGEWRIVGWDNIGQQTVTVAEWTEVCADGVVPLLPTPQTSARAGAGFVAWNGIAQSDREEPCGPDQEDAVRFQVWSRARDGGRPVAGGE
jgi:hypothetical protein